MDEFTGQTDAELETRFADLYMQIMAGYDSLPLATWTPEYRAARREIKTKEVQFRAIGTELARRLTERTARWRETGDAALTGLNMYTATGMVGRLVEDAHDDSPCPSVGKVVGVVDEGTVEVLWGDRRFDGIPGQGAHEPIDALRPAREGAR